LIKFALAGHGVRMVDATRTLDSTLHIADGERESRVDASRVRRMVDDHFDFVWRVLRRFGVPQGDVDDAAQSCFVVASARLASIGLAEERAFLFQTAVRVALATKRRARRRREDGPEELATAVDSGSSPEVVVERRWARERLDEILDTMPSDLRSVFVLFELEGLTLRELAGVLKVPQGTAASRVRRARAHYEEQIRRLKAKLDRGGAR